MSRFLMISLGAIIGANLRYWVSDWAAQRFGANFPYGTLLINISGSFILGFFMTVIAERFLIDPNWRLLVSIGFLGSYTTFSTFTFESVNMVLSGLFWPGLFNLVGSSLLGILAAGLGIYFGRLV